MMKRIVMSCIAALLVWSASAQNEVLKLDLQTAINIALDESPTIKVANLEIDKQIYVRRQTLGNHLPQLSLGGTYTRALVKSDMGGGVSFEADNTIGAQASLTLPLFVPAVYQGLKMNEEQRLEAVEKARGSRITLINGVKQAYYGILFSKESLQVLRNSETNLKETVANVKMNYDAGFVSEYDYISASVQLSNLQPTIIEAQSAIENTTKTLKMLMGLPLDIEIDVIGNLNDMYVANYNKDITGTDIANNTDLRTMDIQINMLQRSLKLSKAQRMPTISAFGNFQLSGRDPLNLGSALGSGSGDGTYRYDGTIINLGPDGMPISQTPINSIYIPKAGFPTASASSDKFLWTNPISVGVQVGIPIFSGLTNYNKDKQTKNEIAQTQLMRQQAEDNLNVELSKARTNLISAQASMIANKATIEQAQKGYDISKTRYDAGMGTILEVNTSETQLTQAKLNNTQSILNYLLAQAEYEKILGKEE